MKSSKRLGEAKAIAPRIPRAEKPPNVYISGPLYSICDGEVQTTGALVEYSSEALARDTAIK
jgi:hypothetical protein